MPRAYHKDVYANGKTIPKKINLIQIKEIKNLIHIIGVCVCVCVTFFNVFFRRKLSTL